MIKGYGPVSADTKLTILSILNFLLFVPWYQLRVAHEAGEDHPLFAIGLAALTVWTWTQLILLVMARFKHLGKHPSGGGPE
jgi:hypothetical protein